MPSKPAFKKGSPRPGSSRKPPAKSVPKPTANAAKKVKPFWDEENARPRR